MANRLLDQMLIVDIEATCWEGPTPADQESEIIEIGLCLFDLSERRRHGKRSILVRPERSSVSPFCTRLTGLTQEQVAQGISFAEACAQLKDEYSSDRRAWASYGEFDRLRFERQCLARRLTYPFAPRHINVKLLFALRHALPAEVGMSTALSYLELPLEGTHHSGADDAWNIAAIFTSLLGPRV